MKKIEETILFDYTHRELFKCFSMFLIQIEYILENAAEIL